MFRTGLDLVSLEASAQSSTYCSLTAALADPVGLFLRCLSSLPLSFLASASR